MDIKIIYSNFSQKSRELMEILPALIAEKGVCVDSKSFRQNIMDAFKVVRVPTLLLFDAATKQELKRIEDPAPIRNWLWASFGYEEGTQGGEAELGDAAGSVDMAPAQVATEDYQPFPRVTNMQAQNPGLAAHDDLLPPMLAHGGSARAPPEGQTTGMAGTAASGDLNSIGSYKLKSSSADVRATADELQREREAFISSTSPRH